jgi:DNA-binding transcriptional regulator LsrR (DeoR family)
MGGRKSSELSYEMKQRVTLAAELYYLYHLTQNEIAIQMGVSRVWVGKLLKVAEDMGFVRIEVNTLSAGISELESALTNQFGLKHAKVVRCTGTEPSLQTTARAAANYLAGILRQNDRICTFSGLTLAAIASELVPLSFPDVTVIPFVGGIGFNPSVTPNQIAYMLAEKLSAKVAPLHAPGFVAGRTERDLLLRDPSICQIINASENAEIFLISLGPLRNPGLVSTRSISDEEFSQLEAVGCVGEICMNFLDIEGRPVDHPIQERRVSGNLQMAHRRAREVIVVANGIAKAEILRATMVGQWVDTVVTDEDTARAVLEM